MPKCIYCLESKEVDKFNSDHVLPEMFGKFHPTSLVLQDTVCIMCNSFFGQGIETALGRDSVEGLSRFTYGSKKSSEFKSFGKDARLHHFVSEGDFEGFEGYLSVNAESGELQLRPIEGVQILRSDDLSDFFPIDEIPEYDAEIHQRIYPRGVGRYRINGDPHVIVGHMQKLGWPIEIEEETFVMEPGPIKTWTTAVVDKDIFRAITKIALNYLASSCGNEYVLDTQFDEIRDFVRYGKQSNSIRIERAEAMSLSQRSFTGNCIGHFLGVYIDKRGRVQAIVTFFSRFTYLIDFGNSSGKERQIYTNFSFFDDSTNKVSHRNPRLVCNSPVDSS